MKLSCAKTSSHSTPVSSATCQSNLCTHFVGDVSFKSMYILVFMVSILLHLGSLYVKVAMFGIHQHPWNIFDLQPYLEKLWIFPMLYPFLLSPRSLSIWILLNICYFVTAEWLEFQDNRTTWGQYLKDNGWGFFQIDSMWFPHLLSCVLHTPKVVDFYFSLGFTFP